MIQRAVFVVLSLLSYLFGHSLPAGAQERGEPLTLAEAIETALAHSPVLQAAQQEVAMARAGVDQARAGFLPTLDVQEAFSRSDNPLFVYGAKIGQGVLTQEDFTVDLLNNPDETDNFHTTLAVVQPLYNGGKAVLEMKRAKLQQQARDRNLDHQRQEVIFAVARAYYGILLAQKNQLVIRSALKTAEATVRLAQDRFETGLVVESDLLSAQVRLARLQEQDITASHQAVLAQASLNDAMGLALDEQWAIDDQLSQRPVHYSPLEELQKLALEKRPDYQRLHVEEQSLGKKIALARTAFFPTLSARAQYEINNKYFAARGQDSWLVGVVLQWNLFNGAADRARLAEAQADFERSRALRTRLASRVRLEVLEAFLQWQTAEERIKVAQKAVSQAEAALRIVTDRYQTGLTTIVDLLASEEALTQTQGNLTRALYDWNVSLASLELAQGTLSRDSF